MSKFVMSRTLSYLLGVFICCLVIGFCGCWSVEPISERTIQETEAEAYEYLSQLFPHDQGYTYGVVCYHPRWCNVTVLHPNLDIQVQLYQFHCPNTYTTQGPCRIIQP